MGAKSKQFLLGIDGGATKTTWSLCRQTHGILQVVETGSTGPGSMKLLNAAALRRLLDSLPKNVNRVGLFLAGCATPSDHAVLRSVAAAVWPQARLQIGSDRESGFAAAFGHGNGIAVIAGTGSAVTGRKDGREERAGGWGHLLGDSGGGYDLAIHALRRILFDFDTAQHITPLASDVLRHLGLNTLRDLTDWVQTAHKSDLARLTPIVFDHAREPDAAATLRDGAETLATLTAAVARRLNFSHPAVKLTGGVFLKQPLYRELFAAALEIRHPGCKVSLCETPASLGAALLASEGRQIAMADPPPFHEPSLHLATTEQPHPDSTELDRLPVHDLVALFIREERAVENALRHVTGDLIRAVAVTTAALKSGGRLFYAGAGTSGRLGVLDASEMPPTFGVSPQLVQALMAGGPTAIQHSVEGAEDDAAAGAHAVRDRGVTARDVLCGLTASGRTPFVRGALEEARVIGAATLLITCNPARPPGGLTADVEIDLPTGAELLTGSTRLKAGTATKAALNILSSCTMIQLGHVEGNLMAGLRPSNAKLRDRAVRIVATRLGVATAEAKKRLDCTNWNIRDALQFSAPDAKP